jgi:glycosyltransferase involved in cell wall biosynthesis
MRGDNKLLISILIPTWNEEENIDLISEAIIDLFQTDISLDKYNYEIIFIDNCSRDNTRQKIMKLCENHSNIRAIFNTRNFGQFNSPYYGLCQTQGDCTILISADFQDPVAMIPVFIHEWENGYQVVCGIKTSSKENGIMYFLRSVYYKIIQKMSQVDQIEHFTGFGLYDKSFINILRQIDDSSPFLRGIVAELGSKRKDIPYQQAKRHAGRTSNNFYTLYDAAMLSFTSYTKIGMRLATFIGFALSVISLLVATAYFILKLIMWDEFPAGMLPILLGVMILGSLQMFFIGLLGEYILTINTRVMKRPLVIEERRVNFQKGSDI